MANAKVSGLLISLTNRLWCTEVVIPAVGRRRVSRREKATIGGSRKDEALKVDSQTAKEEVAEISRRVKEVVILGYEKVEQGIKPLSNRSLLVGTNKEANAVKGARASSAFYEKKTRFKIVFKACKKDCLPICVVRLI